MIYANLVNIDLFVKCVIGDPTFKMGNVQKALRILKKHRSYEEVSGLNMFIEKLNVVSELVETDLEDQILDEAPEVFLCPISYCFMKDPVKLPSSGQTVDRSTIRRILLDDGLDPFNRSPITIDQVEDDLEMKERIEIWKRQKLAGEVTDEEKREQAENAPVPSAKDEDSSMSVDHKLQESPEKPSQIVSNDTDSQMAVNFDSMTEEEQMKYAMEMSMRDYKY